MYDLEADGGGAFLRVEKTGSPRVSERSRGARERSDDLNEERETKDDGRYIIFYSFEDEPEEREEQE